MSSYTMQQVVDMGRIPLNDDNKSRITDAVALTFARNAILMLLQRRPDLFYGRFLALPTIATLALTDTFPVDDTIAPAVADFITARSETRNDEAIVEQRAALFFSLFKEGAL